MKLHPYANLFPDISESGYAELKQSIRKNGQREPIVCDEESGEVIDGRHRYRACRELGIEPKVSYRAFASNEERLAFVLDANLHRRHLNESQRAMLAARIATMKRGDNQHSREVAQICATSQSEAAATLHSSRRAVQQAAVVLQKGTPGLISACDSGAVRVSDGEKVARMPEEEQQELLRLHSETNKPLHQIRAMMKRNTKRKEIIQNAPSPELPTQKRYAVIYADPPWRYEVTPMGHTNRSIENHYPTMSAEEIQALPIAARACEDSVLFLWATVPNLPVALTVMEAWGFEYKSHLIWDKVHMGTGYHARNQHELLLIGRRGELPLPEPGDVPPSVLRIERTEHSAKPEEFAALIDRMYPDYPRIELFARTKRPGWDCWGYEAHTKEEESPDA